MLYCCKLLCYTGLGAYVVGKTRRQTGHTTSLTLVQIPYSNITIISMDSNAVSIVGSGQNATEFKCNRLFYLYPDTFNKKFIEVARKLHISMCSIFAKQWKVGGGCIVSNSL